MSGPSGSGKTYSALKLARGLASDWNKIALIDTENGRGDLYSDLGEYNIITLEAPFRPERFIEAIKACEGAGMEVIIIDSISHEWEGSGGCLELNELIAQSKFRGNTWSAWSETTPRHQKFIESIIASPCHIITTMRSKVETVMTDEKKVKKIGTKDIQREGFEYEMTVSFNIDRDKHLALAGKDNTHLFESADAFTITEEHGKQIKDWSESGKKECPTDEQTEEFKGQLKTLGMTEKKWNEAVKKQTGKEWKEMSIKEAGEWIKKNNVVIEDRARKAEDLHKAEKILEEELEKMVDEVTTGEGVSKI
jgi:hypothetical protein